jgi:hypothetical protein
VKELRDRIIRVAASARRETECRVVPLMVPILRSSEHPRNFVKSSVRRCGDFSITFYGVKIYVLFYCHLRPGVLYK